ncbi:hypothetical protein JZ751_017526 [Albula glossodonta]|uniref:Uncharacterized protein n=1 Tax=Albula glossodonta TaxID=121402 RepID=A0A8T2PL25_9TELE|nr:hypothetical protein JZ751_017526 [Albula glossodonta]
MGPHASVSLAFLCPSRITGFPWPWCHGNRDGIVTEAGYPSDCSTFRAMRSSTPHPSPGLQSQRLRNSEEGLP